MKYSRTTVGKVVEDDRLLTRLDQSHVGVAVDIAGSAGQYNTREAGHLPAMINETLRRALATDDLKEALREVIREELHTT